MEGDGLHFTDMEAREKGVVGYAPKATATPYTYGPPHNPEANKLEWLSLLFFLLGGIFYIISAVWDYSLVENDPYFNFRTYDLIMVNIFVGAMSGLGYLFTGLTDLYIIKVRCRDVADSQIRDDVTTFSLESNARTTSSDIMQSKMEAMHIEAGEVPCEIITTHTTKVLQHHFVVSLFLIWAALFDVASVILELYNETYSEFSKFVSCHLYFVEASIALFGMSCCRKYFREDSHDITALKHSYKIVQFLDKSGDFLFFVGSFVDVATSYLYLDPEFGSVTVPYFWTVVSSVLWTIDALLYIIGAYIFESYQKDNENISKIKHESNSLK